MRLLLDHFEANEMKLEVRDSMSLVGRVFSVAVLEKTMTGIERLYEVAKLACEKIASAPTPRRACEDDVDAEMRAAIAAYEAEQADRALPVQEEWLNRLGYESVPHGCWVWFKDSTGNTHAHWMFQQDGKWISRLVTIDVEMESRGQVVDLLKSLGVNLGK